MTIEQPNLQELQRFMQEAMAEARKGYDEGGIPIGSVLLRQGKVIGRGHNRRVQNDDPTAHAEIDCLKNAGRIGKYQDTILVSTLMPCALCAGASIQFKIPLVVAGENRTFCSSRKVMEAAGITVIDLDLDDCYNLMKKFAEEQPLLWKEDIGEL
ncbi:MAG TPA: nucleoside deaminase [Planktothrix sp.]